MPECTDVVFRYGLSENARAIIDMIAQRTLADPQQTNSKRDQPSRKPAFDLQFFLRDVFADFFSAQRYAPGLGNPIWSRMRQTTVSTTAVRESGRLRKEGTAGRTIPPASSKVTTLRA